MMFDDIKNFFGAFLLYTIASILIAISLIPSYFLVKFSLTLSNIFLKLFLIAFSYFVFGFFLMIIVALVVRIFNIRLKPGTYKIGSI
ncbi:MAG: hypothetical protein ACP5H3_03905, partial [Candidatus Aenigmatarchaeota archaeon]